MRIAIGLVLLVTLLCGCHVYQRRRADLDGECTNPDKPKAYVLQGNVWAKCSPAGGSKRDLYCCPD